MDITYNKELTKNSYGLLREAGYLPIHDHKTGKQSYIRRITGDRYPRFHIYVKEETENSIIIHLHLDNREHGFGDSLHNTNYDSENVKAEGERLKRWLLHFTKKESKQPPKKQDKGLLSKLFGG